MLKISVNMRTNILKTITIFALLFMAPASMARDMNSRILVMGDSLLAAHSISRRAVAHSIEATLGQKVVNNSVVGARIIYKLPISGALGLNISKQYRKGNWDWVVLSGGGNDLMLGCGCNKCDRKIRRMISASGASGEVPRLVSKLRRTGAKVIYVGYLRSPGVGSPIESCKDEGDEFESRINKMAQQNEGVYFLSLADLVPHGDRSFHAIDMIHPSLKASKIIGQMVSKIISSNSK
jgi:hypothetical protein